MFTLRKMMIVLTVSISLISTSIGDTASWNNITSFNFNEVEVGSSKQTNVTITNISDQDVSLLFNFQSNSEFAWLPNPLNTITILANESINLNIAFSPNSIGDKNASLYITDGTPSNFSHVKFYGTGIEPKPQVCIEDIIEFFDASVFLGQITGRQNTTESSAYPQNDQYDMGKNQKGSNLDQNRLNAFRNMIISVADVIEKENFSQACEQLSELYSKTDGEFPPVSAPDFIYGQSKQTLASMIVSLRRQHKCD